jgi:aldehyde dehydrogenase (NAD+)
MYDKVYIDGEWISSTSDEMIDVFNPSTEEPIARVVAGSAEDVDRAVRAARRAFAGWSMRSADERCKLLAAAHAAITRREEDFVTVIATDVGVPLKMARRLQLGLPMAILDSFTDPALVPADEELGNSLITREPIGVVGAITPWNYPLHQTMAKVAPALAAGCTIVLKPSEVTPLVVYLLAEVFDEIGLPPGVFNLVSGYGPVVGAALVSHPEVDMVSFTGSTTAGRQVAAAASMGIKKVSLELGGKSPNVILPDVDDLAKIVRSGVGNCYLNTGQTCLALTRMLVHRSQYEEAVQVAALAAEAFTVGDPFDASTKLGPLTSAAHLARVRGYIEQGIAEGARLVAGGPSMPEGIERGYFVRPTVFADVTADMTIAKEEIFGPVLVILVYDTEDEAVELANGTQYGLTAGVWSGDADRALAVARRIRAGQVDVNGGAFNPRAPFGGYKQSGNGRELGSFGLEEFLEVKAIQR